METLLNFGQALEELKIGKKISRLGWNGKGMFLYYVPAEDYPPTTQIGKQLMNHKGLVEYGAYIAIKNAQGYVIPWLPSQTDLLSSDWIAE
jgi:hypothetical protein